MPSVTTPEGLQIHSVCGSQGDHGEQWYVGFEVTLVKAPTTEYPVMFHRDGNPGTPVDSVPTNYVILDYSARDCTQVLISFWDSKGFLFPPLIIQGNVWHERLITRIRPREMSGVNIRVQSNGTGHFEIQAIGFKE